MEKYRESLKKQAKLLRKSTDGLNTGELLEDLVRGGAEDLHLKREAEMLNSKDFSVLLKLIEGHAKLETVKLKRSENEKGSVEEAERLLIQLGVPPELVRGILGKPTEALNVEEADSDEG